MTASTTAARGLVLFACLALQGSACSETTHLVGDGASRQSAQAVPDAALPNDATVAAGKGAGSDAASDATLEATPRSLGDGGVIQCGKQPCACSNRRDDDGDALSDGRDPECIGAGDDDELSFATGAEHDRENACQDCFFDGNSGAGNDGCRRAASCSTQGDAQSGSGACRSCDVGDRCVEQCRSLTPNGCDCFGCCEVHLPAGAQLTVMLRGGCSMATLADLDVCQPCIKATACENPCEVCELCLGKGTDDLPDSCGNASGDPDAPRHTCGDGEPVCDETHSCPSHMYCQWGCCLPLLF